MSQRLAWTVVLCIVAGAVLSIQAHAKDWPQWGGQAGRNMASEEKGLPESFLPGHKSGGAIDMRSTRNVKWIARLGDMTCSTPAVAEGRLLIGTMRDSQGVLLCLDEQTGGTLWQLSAPARKVSPEIQGRKIWFNVFPAQLGICSSPSVDGDRVYFVTHRCEVACAAAPGAREGDRKLPGHWTGNGHLLWLFDMWDMGVRPSDACNCSVLVHGGFVYVCTSNGVDRDADARKKDEFRKPPAPDAPTLIVLEKSTGRLVAVDNARVGPRVLHGQWSSPSLGKVGDKTLIFLGGGDGLCYAFEDVAGRVSNSPSPDIPTGPQQVVNSPRAALKLKTAWSFDANPPDYKQFGKLDLITHYCRGDRRRTDTINGNDGTFPGMSEIIATPVFYDNRVYVAIGRDPEHGRGRGALYCIDPTRTGDITGVGRVWCYQGLDRTLSTVSIADGLLYVADVAGRLHCVEAATGRGLWIHETGARIWGSTLVADGKVYLPTDKALWVLAAGRQKRELAKIALGSPVWSSPVAANGVLFVASTKYLWAVK